MHLFRNQKRLLLKIIHFKLVYIYKYCFGYLIHTNTVNFNAAIDNLFPLLLN